MSDIRIHHFSLTCPENVMKETAAFYQTVLGLEIGFRPDFGFNGIWLYAGEHPIIHLMEDNNRNGEKSGYFDHVALRCDNKAAVTQTLEENGIEFFQLEQPAVGQVQVFVTDPAGTTVELNFEMN